MPWFLTLRGIRRPYLFTCLGLTDSGSVHTKQIYTCRLPRDIQQICCSTQTGQHSPLQGSCCAVWALTATFLYLSYNTITYPSTLLPLLCKNCWLILYYMYIMQALEELQSEILGSETVAAPERNPLDFATVSTQTDPPPPPPSPSPQVWSPPMIWHHRNQGGILRLPLFLLPSPTPVHYGAKRQESRMVTFHYFCPISQLSV